MKDTLAAEIIMACATMFVRLLLATSMLNVVLFQNLLPVFALMGSVACLSAFLCWRKAREFNPEQGIKVQRNWKSLAMLF